MDNREQLSWHKEQVPTQYLFAMGYDVSKLKGNKDKVSGQVELGDMKISFFKSDRGPHFLYKCFNPSKTGTIVDIAKDYARGDINSARKFLNSVNPPPGIVPSFSTLAPTTTNTKVDQNPQAPISSPPLNDLFLLEQLNMTIDSCDAIDTLAGDFLQSRGISEVGPGYNKMLLIARGHYQNLVVPYADYGRDMQKDKLEICGIEEKYHNAYRRYTTGGRAGIWLSGNMKANILFVAESPIDCLSYAKLKSWNPNLQLCAIRSGSEKVLDKYILQNSERLSAGILVGTDQDAAGAEYASKIFASCKKYVVKAKYAPPPSFYNDWNDFLMSEIAKRSHPTQADVEVGHQSHRNGAGKPSKSTPLHIRPK